MSKLLFALFIAALLAPIYSQEECPEENLSYKIFLIDAKVTSDPDRVGCNYTIGLVSGDCALDSGDIMESPPGNLCYNTSSMVCDFIDPAVMGGYVIVQCNNSMIVEPIEPKVNYSFSEEFEVKSESLSAKVYVVSACNATENATEEWSTPGLRTCQVPEGYSHNWGYGWNGWDGWDGWGRRRGKYRGRRCKGRRRRCRKGRWY